MKRRLIIDGDEIVKPDYYDFFNSGGVFKTRIGDVKTKECQLWENMRMRVCNKLRSKQKTYSNIHIFKPWLDFQVFAEWVTNQPNWNVKGWELDKDILGYESNLKCYSPQNCCFIPKGLNNILNDTNSKRGAVGHVGICLVKGKYYSRLRSKYKDYSFFSESLEDCINFYKVSKKEHVGLLLQEYSQSLQHQVVQKIKEIFEID